MTTPEDVLARAREAAASAEARAAAHEVEHGWHVEPRDEITAEQLAEWAVLEPDEGQVRSTRAAGAPITLAKKGLLRVLRQYHAQLIAEQTRVNLQLVVYAARLEERVAALEARVTELEDDGR